MEPVLIPLQRGLVAKVSPEDAERVLAHPYKWYVNDKGYAISNGSIAGGKCKKISLHRFILNFPSYQIDHRDRDKMNNTRENLRPATVAQNAVNRAGYGRSSQFKGVQKHGQVDKWVAILCTNGKRKHIGLYATEIEAALAWDRAAIEAHGEFAVLNFPELHAFS